MSQNPLKKFKSPILIEILEILEILHIFLLFFHFKGPISAWGFPINRPGGLYGNPRDDHTRATLNRYPCTKGGSINNHLHTGGVNKSKKRKNGAPFKGLKAEKIGENIQNLKKV